MRQNQAIYQTSFSSYPERKLPETRLAQAVFFQFSKDLHQALVKGCQEEVEELLSWLDSDWAHFWAQIAGINLKKLKKALFTKAAISS